MDWTVGQRIRYHRNVFYSNFSVPLTEKLLFGICFVCSFTHSLTVGYVALAWHVVRYEANMYYFFFAMALQFYHENKTNTSLIITNLAVEAIPGRQAQTHSSNWSYTHFQGHTEYGCQCASVIVQIFMEMVSVFHVCNFFKFLILTWTHKAYHLMNRKILLTLQNVC